MRRFESGMATEKQKTRRFPDRLRRCCAAAAPLLPPMHLRSTPRFQVAQRLSRRGLGCRGPRRMVRRCYGPLGPFRATPRLIARCAPLCPRCRLAVAALSWSLFALVAASALAVRVSNPLAVTAAASAMRHELSPLSPSDARMPAVLAAGTRHKAATRM